MTEHAGVVALTHRIDRDGRISRYETVNHCTLRDSRLSSWFSYPMIGSDYAEAWGLQSPLVRSARS